MRKFSNINKSNQDKCDQYLLCSLCALSWNLYGIPRVVPVKYLTHRFYKSYRVTLLSLFTSNVEKKEFTSYFCGL